MSKSKIDKCPFCEDDIDGCCFCDSSGKQLEPTPDYFKSENELVANHFNLNKVIEFTLKHDVEVVRLADYNYLCYIDKQGYSPSLTTMGALWFGITEWERRNP